MSNILFGAFIAVLALTISSFLGDEFWTPLRFLRIASIWGMFWLGLTVVNAILRVHKGR